MNEYRYYIKKTHKPVPDIVVLELADIKDGPIFNFKPGQYVMISYRNAKGRLEEKHTFSIASSPLRKNSIRLGIRIMGRFTTGLSKLKEGHEIFVSGPFGNFVFDEKKHRETVFIAGGVGITPFISSLAYAADKRLSNKMDLLYSSRTIGGAIFSDEIIETEKQRKNIRAIFSITDEKLGHESDHIITERINAVIIKRFVGNVNGKTFFLCGPVPFMDAMKENLARIGVHESQIKTEEFSMIPDTSSWLRVRNMGYALGLAAALFALIFYTIQNITNSTSSAIAVPNNTDLNQPSSSAGSITNSSQAQQRQTVPMPSRRTRTS